MTKAKVILTSIVLSLLISGEALAQKEKFQSMFIYNFSRYIKWPDGMNSGEFVIGIIGSDAKLHASLVELSSNKRSINGDPIVIKQFKSVEEIENCHILYVTSGKLSSLSQISNSTKSKSTLLITDSPGMAKKGSTINFVEKNGKINFELNQDNASGRNLKVSGSLSSLAILV